MNRKKFLLTQKVIASVFGFARGTINERMKADRVNIGDPTFIIGWLLFDFPYYVYNEKKIKIPVALRQLFRRYIFLTKGTVCSICGETEKINIHHIKPVNKYPEFIFCAPNVIPLCIECHAKEHEKMGEKTTANLIRNTLFYAKNRATD